MPALLCSLLLAVELYVLLYDIEGSPQITSAKPVIAKYLSGVNEVLSKPSGTITWHAPSPGSELRREDTVLTMSNSQALVQFTDGTEMGIEPDSLVVLEKTVGDEASQQKIVVRLVQGSLAKKAGGTMPIAVDVEDKKTGKRTRIEDESGSSSFRLLSSAEGVSLQVESGNVKLGDGADAKVIKANEQATIKGAQIEVKRMPVQFGKLYPETGRKIARAERDEAVALNWRQIAADGEAEAESKLIVSRKPDFSDAVEVDVDAEGEEGKAKFEPEQDGTYYWRLETKDGEVKSPAASFSVVTRAAPEIESHSDDIEAIVGQPVSVRWKPVASAANVFIETADNEEFANAQRFRPRGDPTSVELKFDQPLSLYWRARADYGPEVGVSPPTETKRLIVKPKPLLRPPKVSKPKIRFSNRPFPRKFRIYTPAFFSAPSKTRNATIDLAWDLVDGAEQYRLQIARDEHFKSIVVDKKARHTSYVYKTPLLESEQTFYYRVASIDPAGDQGAFSDPMEISIPPLPKPTSDSGSLASEEEDLPKKTYWRLDLHVGAAYHSREFKSEARPVSAKGSGMIPMAGGLEFRRVLGQTEDGEEPWGVFDIGASVIGEKAEPTTKNVIVDQYPVSLLRAWVMVEKNFWGTGGGLGLYASTSNKFTWAGRRANVARLMLIGVSAELLSSPLQYAKHFQYRAHLGLIGAGALGADLNLSGRFMFSKGRAVRIVDQTGLFVEGEVFTRYLNIETSFGGAFKLGYSF